MCGMTYIYGRQAVSVWCQCVHVCEQAHVWMCAYAVVSSGCNAFDTC